MNKIDLIQALKDTNNLPKSEAEKIVSSFFNQMSDALAQGIELKSGDFVPFSSKNPMFIPAETLKPARRLRLHRKNYHFSRWARNWRIGWMGEIRGLGLVVGDGDTLNLFQLDIKLGV